MSIGPLFADGRQSASRWSLLVCATLFGCGEQTGPTPPDPPPTVAFLDVTPSAVDVIVGETAQLDAQLRAADGTVLDRPASWTSDDPAIAIVDAGGQVTGTGSGTTLVTASSEGVSGSARITVAGGSQTEVDVVLSPGQNVQEIIDNNPPGTVFGFEPGTYARLELTPKDNQVFIGGAGVVLDGMNDTRFAFHGGAVGLHLRDLEITGYVGVEDDLAAIHGWSGVNWVLENLDVHHNYTSGASVRHGGRIIGGRYHHNGQLGIYVTQTRDVVISGAEISHNNLERRYDPLWEAGGIKVTVSDDVTVENAFVHNNIGPGIWYDIRCTNGNILDNTVRANSHSGVFYEISSSGLIQGNLVEGNGSDHKSPFGAGIFVINSSDVRVQQNVLIDNAHGIIGLMSDRGTGQLFDLKVLDNEIEMLRGSSGLLDSTEAGAPDLVTGSGNLFDNNRYRIGELPQPFFAGTNSMTIAQWQALGQDQSSEFVVF